MAGKRAIILDTRMLIQLRTSSGLNRYEAADRIGVSLNTLKKAEKGSPLFFATARQIAQFYRVPFEELCAAHERHHIKAERQRALRKSQSFKDGLSENGHQFELLQIDQRLEWAAVCEQPTFVHIRGQCGIGKTHVLRAALATASEKSFVCIEQPISQKLNWMCMCHDWLQQLELTNADANAEAISAGIWRANTNEEPILTSEDLLIQFLSTHHIQLVLALDDIHNASESFTCNLVRFSNRLKSHAAAILVTSCLEDEPFTSVFHRHRSNLPAASLTLAPLTTSQLRHIADGFKSVEIDAKKKAITECLGIPLLLVEELGYLSGQSAADADAFFCSAAHKLHLISETDRLALDILALIDMAMSLRCPTLSK